MNENMKNMARRKVCPFLVRTSTEADGGSALTRTWFPRCIGETCAAYSPTGDARAVCVRLGTDLTLPEDDGRAGEDG